jgi:arylformamidase
MPLFEGMPAFPGDPPFRVEPVASLERGDPYAVARLSLGSHAGTHVDAPRHFDPNGTTVDRLELDVLNGPCQVVDARGGGADVGPSAIAALPPGTSRVLFRTDNSVRWTAGPGPHGRSVGLELATARILGDLGVRLVGLDALSVETDRSGRFPVHRELLGRGIVIVEGLLLDGVAAGPYELTCLPLPVRGGDGAPARVVLTSP